VCRRVEREVVTLVKTEKINEKIEVYLNRLSDLLFVLARYDNYLQKVEDVMWQK
jgi:cob(I)alamin adenosyltransferase